MSDKNYNPPLMSYLCSECGAFGVKLWREYNTFAPKLFCISCVCDKSEDHLTPEDFNEAGKVEGWRPGLLTDQVVLNEYGTVVPAVPDEENIGYWGYTSVPLAGCNWWATLPNRRGESTDE